MPDCSSIQKSLAWCQGRPELPGVKRRIYYISKGDILQWPVLNHDANGRLTTASYAGDFILRADAKWKYIDILPDKSQLTSDPQGEYPSQTQLNKLVAVHPGVGAQASEAAAYLNNNDNVFLVADMRGGVRVVGSEKWITKSVVNQDLGQGATGSTSTTITVEATDECPAPFYAGTIDTDEGVINPGGNPNQATGGTGSGGQSSGSGGSSSSGSSSNDPVYDSTITINSSKYTLNKGDSDTVYNYLETIRFTGRNMEGISVEVEGNGKSAAKITNGGTQATWSQLVEAPSVVTIYRKEKVNGSLKEVIWATLTLVNNDNYPQYGD